MFESIVVTQMCTGSSVADPCLSVSGAGCSQRGITLFQEVTFKCALLLRIRSCLIRLSSSSVLPQPLKVMMGSDDETLQEAAAGCVRNIRILALVNEMLCSRHQ